MERRVNSCSRLTRFYSLHGVQHSELSWADDLVMHSPVPANRQELTKALFSRIDKAMELFGKFGHISRLEKETIAFIDSHLPLLAACKKHPEGSVQSLLGIFPDRVPSLLNQLTRDHIHTVKSVVDGPPCSRDPASVKLLRKGSFVAQSMRYIQAQISRAVKNPQGSVHALVGCILKTCLMISGESGGICGTDAKKRLRVYMSDPIELYAMASDIVSKSKLTASVVWHTFLGEFITQAASTCPDIRLRIGQRSEWTRHKEWIAIAIRHALCPDLATPPPPLAHQPKHNFPASTVLIDRIFSRMVRRTHGKPFDLLEKDRVYFPSQVIAAKQKPHDKPIKESMAMSQRLSSSLSLSMFSASPLSKIEHDIQITRFPVKIVMVCASCLIVCRPGSLICQLNDDPRSKSVVTCKRCTTQSQIRVRINGALIRDILGTTQMCSLCGSIIFSEKDNGMKQSGAISLCRRCYSKTTDNKHLKCRWCNKWRVGTAPIIVNDDIISHENITVGICPQHNRNILKVLPSLNFAHPLSILNRIAQTSTVSRGNKSLLSKHQRKRKRPLPEWQESKRKCHPSRKFKRQGRQQCS